MDNKGRLKTDDVIDRLIPVRLFDSLDPEELSIVAGYMNLVEVKAGDLVFREGREGNYVCFVAEGELEVVKKNAAGKEVVLTTLKRGASIGEMAILDEQPRSATVTAKANSILITLSKNSFQRLLNAHPRIGLKILIGLARLLSQYLRSTTANLADVIPHDN